MPSNIIMQVKVNDKFVVLHPETTASQVKLASGKTLQEYIDEHDVVKVENGRLYRKTANGSFELVTSVSSEFSLDPATGVSFESTENRIAVKWTDPLDMSIESSSGTIALATWAGTKLVAKVGTPPTNMNDGITLVDSKVRDQYKVTPYLTSLDMNKTYYLKLFPYTDEGIDTIIGDSLSVTTTNIILDEPVGSAVSVDDKVYLTWTDPVDKTASFNGSTVDTAKWLKTIVVKKVGSTPSGVNDGDIVTEVTTKNVYQTNPFIVSGLAEGLTYFKFFPVTVDGSVTIGSNTQYPVTVSHGSLPDATNLSITRDGEGANITWTDAIEPTIPVAGSNVKSAAWLKTVVVMKNGSEPTSINDGTKVKESTVYNQYKTTPLNVPTISKDTSVHFKVFSISTNNKITAGVSTSIQIDSTNLPSEVGPGKTTLSAGSISAGYFGIVSSSNFITGDALATALSFTMNSGNSINSNTDWLKFAIDGKIIFVPAKPIRHFLSWDEINNADLVYGRRTVKIGNLYYKVRLMKGAENDPAIYTDVDRDAIGSEWNRLMLPIHAKAAAPNTWIYKDYVGNNVPNWSITGIDDTYLGTNDTSMMWTWCQNLVSGSAIVRGGDEYRTGNGEVSYITARGKSTKADGYVWRPVLELIQPSDITDKTGTPGSNVLLKGDTTAGYYGEVTNLINTEALSSLTGVTAGAVFSTYPSWLKFHSEGKVLFIAKTPLRFAISWNALNAAKVVFGETIVRINGIDYKIRLMNAPVPITTGVFNEWTRLLGPTHVESANGFNWGTNFTNADLMGGNLSRSWVQNTHPTLTSYRLSYGGPSNFNDPYGGPTEETAANSWRPVLEPVNQ